MKEQISTVESETEINLTVNATCVFTLNAHGVWTSGLKVSFGKTDITSELSDYEKKRITKDLEQLFWEEKMESYLGKAHPDYD